MATNRTPSSPRSAPLVVAVLLAQAFLTGAEPAVRRYELYHDFGHGFVDRDTVITLTADGGRLTAALEHGRNRNVCNEQDETCVNTDTDDAHRPTEDDVFSLLRSGGWYKVKAVDVATGGAVMTSVSPCELAKAEYRETIHLVLSSRADLVGLDYAPQVSPLAAKRDCAELVPRGHGNVVTFTTTNVSYSSGTPAMVVPVVLSSAMKIPPGGFKMLPRDKNSDAPGVSDLGVEGADGAQGNKSFMMKYWYIILPIFIISFMTSEDAPAEGQPATAAAAATATGVAAAAGAAPKVRRGKRG